MNTPRYVAKRIGKEYVLVRVDAPQLLKRMGVTTAGLLLLGWALPRRGMGAAIGTLAGAALTYQGWTGHNVVGALLKTCSAIEDDPTQGPSYPHRGPRSGQLPEDKIDEAAMESFPASDPPASHRSSEVSPVSETSPVDESPALDEPAPSVAASSETQITAQGEASAQDEKPLN